MPPPDNSPASVVRYLTRLLAALTVQSGGELHIPLRAIRAIELESSRQMLSEDTDVKKDELVLRFGTKHSAVYPVEGECKTQPTPVQNASTASIQPTGQTAPTVRPPLSPSEEAKLELALRAKRMKRRIVQQQAQRNADAQNDLSEILGPNSTS